MFLYIDPGTGSMLFTILIGIIGASVFSLRMLFIKLRFKLSGGNAKTDDKKLPIVIFSDNKRYWSVFEPVCRELSDAGEDVVYMTMSDDDKALECTYPHFKAEFIGSENKAFMRLNFLNAHIVLSTTPGLDVYQWKRSRQVSHYVHIPHAASEITLYRMFGIDYYDAILLSGEYQVNDVRKLEQLRSLPEKELVITGIPYMDEMAKRLAQSTTTEHPRTVLLAPSWGKSAILSVYGAEIIKVLISTGYNVIIRPHPQSFSSEKELIDKLMKEFPNGDKLQWNSDTDNFNVLLSSDILISDFSGVIFDFALVYDKPVIYTDPNFDLGMYDAWWLDQPLWTASALPRLGAMLTQDNMNDLKSLIDTCLSDPAYAEGRKSVKSETWANFGIGAKSTADYLISKRRALTEKEDKKG